MMGGRGCDAQTRGGQHRKRRRFKLGAIRSIEHQITFLDHRNLQAMMTAPDIGSRRAWKIAHRSPRPYGDPKGILLRWKLSTGSRQYNCLDSKDANRPVVSFAIRLGGAGFGATAYKVVITAPDAPSTRGRSARRHRTVLLLIIPMLSDPAVL